MGYARNASSGDKRSWWTLRQNTPKGAPVPGTGGRHGRRKNKSGSNKSGALNKLNLEWGSTNRKQEDDQRGINNRARRQAIEDQVESWVEYVTIDGEPVAVIDSLSEKWQHYVEDGWADGFHAILDTEMQQDYNDMWADDGDIYAGTYQGDL